MNLNLITRIATSWARGLPDTLIIGGRKCGTTSLFHYLAEHPQVAASFKKEVEYFSKYYRYGPVWYRSNFPVQAWGPLSSGGTSYLESTPYYLTYPHAAKRAAGLLPDARIVVLLRNPVDRAHSQFHDMKRRGVEHNTFEDALEREDERIKGEYKRMVDNPAYFSKEFHLYSYKRCGLYANDLQNWLEVFPLENFLFLESEELFREPKKVWREALDFLDLDCIQYPGGKYNTGRYPAMDNATRERLSAFFNSHNRKLVDTIGRDFSWI